MSSPPLSPRHLVIDEEANRSGSRGYGPSKSYKDVTANDHAHLQIGDRYYGPVNIGGPAKLEEERTEVLDSLNFEEMESRFLEIRSHLAGTCEWLLDTPEYQRWQDPSLMPEHHGFLWIKGKAGAGKSTILKYASETATRNCLEREHVLNFFFNARGGPMEASPEGLLRTMLFQILDKIPRLYNTLDNRRFNLAIRQTWSVALLREAFRDAILHLGQDRVTCFVDAMDECNHEDVRDVVRFFDDLGDSAVAEASQFYVCLSSRHYPNLRISKSVELVLEHQQGHSKDIEDYIQRRLLVDDQSLKIELARTIERNANGVFLWVVLVGALLNADDCRGDVNGIRNRLDQVPAELHGVFDEMLDRGVRNRHLCAILMWTTLGVRTLTGDELYSILESTEAALTNQRLGSQVSKLPSPATISKFILESSKGLVETVESERVSRRDLGCSRVRFIHESTRTYFMKEGLQHLSSDWDVVKHGSDIGDIQALKSESTEITIARYHDQLKKHCLFYLIDTVSSRVEPPVSLEGQRPLPLRQLQQKSARGCPFFMYAIRGIWLHAEQAHNRGISQLAFLTSLPLRKLDLLTQFGESRGMQQRFRRFPYTFREVPCGNPPWYVAYLVANSDCPGLMNAVLTSLSLSEITWQQWCAILAAALKKRPDHTYDIAIIRLILQHGMHLDSSSSRDLWSSLSIAFHNNTVAHLFLIKDKHRERMSSNCAGGDLERVHQRIRGFESTHSHHECLLPTDRNSYASEFQRDDDLRRCRVETYEDSPSARNYSQYASSEISDSSWSIELERTVN